MTNGNHPNIGLDDDSPKLLGQRLGRRTLLRGFSFAGLGLAGAAVLGCADDDNGDDTATATATTGTGDSTATTEATSTPENGEATAGGILEQARQQGYITIGFANEAPYGFADETGAVTGEAPEVAKAIFAELGVPEVQGVVTTFGALIPGLVAGRFDVIAAGMFINPDRCGQILFSDPDYCIPQAFAVQAGNPLGLTNYEDVANSDATLGVLSGGVEEGYALDLGVPEDRLTLFEDAPSLAEGLQAGRVDAIAATSLSIRAQMDRLGDSNLEMTAGFTPEIDGVPQRGCGGFGFRQEDQELRDAFNDALVAMKGSNSLVAITEPFGFGETEIGAAADVTVEDLCEPAS